MKQTHADSDTTYQFQDAERLSEAVVDAVADAADADPIDLPPLYGVVDPDALDGLFGPILGDGLPSGGRIEFSYAGYDVAVEGDRILLD